MTKEAFGILDFSQWRIWNVMFRGTPVRVIAKEDDWEAASNAQFYVNSHYVFGQYPFMSIHSKFEGVQGCAEEVLESAAGHVDGQLEIDPGSANETEFIIRAAAFASRKHRTQRRKDSEASPYINHPLAVSDILAREGGVSDRIVLAAAILHDTIEDTETTYEELCNQFGVAVADVVKEVTDDKSKAKEERKRLQIEHAADKSSAAKLVKLGDKIANLRDIISSPPADWSREQKLEYFNWAKKVVDKMRGVSPVLEELFDQEYSIGSAEFGTGVA